MLELLGPFEEFAAAVGAMVRRVEAEGVRELVNVRFYGDAGSTEVGVILTFSDRGRMIDHMNMVGGWEEFRAFGSFCWQTRRVVMFMKSSKKTHLMCSIA